MKTAALATGLLFALGGCTRSAAPSPATAITQKAQPPDDRPEVLIRHLVRRIEDLDSEIGKLQNEMIKRQNKCLDDQIAILEDRTPPTNPRRDMKEAQESARAFAKQLNNDMSRTSQWLLDSEAATQDHNRRHPEHPWAESGDVLRLMCGDCAKERAFRDLQLKEEAQKYAPATPSTNTK